VLTREIDDLVRLAAALPKAAVVNTKAAMPGTSEVPGP
jgi:hypothetical protein